MENITTEQMIIGFIIILVALYFWNRRADSEGRLPDAAVTMSNVQQSILDEFELERNPKLKIGYTEKTVEKQLETIFRNNFQSVFCQYGLPGPMGKR